MYSDPFLLRTGNSHRRTKKYTLILLLQRPRTGNFRERHSNTFICERLTIYNNKVWKKTLARGEYNNDAARKAPATMNGHTSCFQEKEVLPGRLLFPRLFPPDTALALRCAPHPPSHGFHPSTRQPPRGRAERGVARAKRASVRRRGRQRSGRAASSAGQSGTEQPGGGAEEAASGAAALADTAPSVFLTIITSAPEASREPGRPREDGSGPGGGAAPAAGPRSERQAAPGGRGPGSHLQRGHSAGEEVLAVFQLLQLGRPRLPHRRGLPLRRHLPSDPAARAHVTPATPLGT